MSEPSLDPLRTVDFAPTPAKQADETEGISLTAPTGPAIPPQPAEGPSIPGYSITGEIAKGGMGRIYAARDLVLDREVAIKTLLPGASAERFVVESKITARLPHPGIPPVHALGVLSDGRPYLAMKFIRGRTLAELLKERRSTQDDLPRFLQIFEQIAQAVGFAHSHGIIHRDLKPLNVMVGAFGEVQVMDWGLAKEIRDAEDSTRIEPATAILDVEFTRAGAVMGTPGYMAPEQARGESVNTQADVFALGAMLAAILTGKPAFVGASAQETIAKAASADLADVAQRLDASGVDPDLIVLARHCLSATPAERPPDGQAVAAQVAGYRARVEQRLRQAETQAAETLVRVAEQQKRRRAMQLAGGLIAAVLVLGIAGTSIGMIRANVAWNDAEIARRAEARRADSEKEARIAEQKAKQRVQRQLTQIEKGVDVMAGMIVGIDPRTEQPGGPTVYEKLAQRASQAADELDAESIGDPLAVARLQTILGNTLDDLGNAPKAIEVLEKALATRERELTLYHVDTLVTLNRLARANEAAGNIPRSLELYEQTRAPRRRRCRMITLTGSSR